MMKNLILLAFMLTSIASKSQTRVLTNADGTQTTVTKTGNTILVIDGSGKHHSVTNNGNTSVVMDGTTYITFARNGGTTTMATSNAGVYNWIDAGAAVNLVDGNGNSSPFNRGSAPFSLSVAGRKFYVSVYADGYTLEHLDGSRLVTTVIGNTIFTDFPEEQPKPQVPLVIAGIRSKIINADGTYTTVIKDGDTYKVKTEYTITRVGNKSIIKNPDGTTVETVIDDSVVKTLVK